MRRFEVLEVDPGFCRVIYKTQNQKGERIYYCIQDEGSWGLKFYRATLPPWFEPEYSCQPKNWALVDLPAGDTELEQKIREFLREKQEVSNG